MPDRSEGRSTPPPDWRSMHLWQFQPVRDLLVVAALLALLYLGYRLSLVTVPMLLAMLLAYLFEPLVQALTARRWFSRAGVAIGIIVAAFFVVVVPVSIGVGTATIQGLSVVESVAADSKSVLTIVRFSRDSRESAKGAAYGQVLWDPVPGVPDEFGPRFEWASAEGKQAAGDAKAALEKLPPKLQRLAAKLVERDHPVPRGGAKPPAPPESDLSKLSEQAIIWLQDNASAIAAALGERALGSGAQAVGATVRTLHWLGRMALSLFLTAFFFFFFSTGYGRVLAFWEGLIPERKKSRVIELLQRMDRVIAGFVRGRLTICATLMVYYTVAYWLIGVPAPLLLGPIVGAFAIIPFITTLAMPLAMVLMVLQPQMHFEWQQHWWWIMGGPVLAYIVERALDDYILTPMIQGRHTEMAVPAILFASLAGGVLAGVYGLLIAIPVAACLRILLKEVFWPRFEAWAEGRERDFLPISREDRHPEGPAST